VGVVAGRGVAPRYRTVAGRVLAAVTLALDSGANLVDVQDMAGHRDPRTTRRYARARGRLDRDPSYALAALLTNG